MVSRWQGYDPHYATLPFFPDVPHCLDGKTEAQGEKGLTEYQKSGPSQDLVPYSTDPLLVGKNSVTINIYVNNNNDNDGIDEHRIGMGL